MASPLSPLKPRNPRVNWRATGAKGLIAAWPFNEGAGAVARDRTGNGYDAAFISATKWCTGRNGSAITFSGSGQYLQLSRSPNPSAATVTAWVNGFGNAYNCIFG